MACTDVPCVLLCCLLLLLPHIGSSFYTLGGKQHVVVFRSPGGASPATFCPDDIPSGDDGGITAPLPVFHRLSPCSPRAGAQSQGNLSVSVADVLNRDALGLRSLLFGTTVPTTGSPSVDYPGAYGYHVVAGYGTPLQRLAVGFDMVGMGLSLLVCKPCAAGASCGRAFDPSRSSTLAQIPCNSLDCPLSSSCSGPTCMSSFKKNGTVWLNTTVVTDKLTLSGSTTLDSFRFACMETSSGATSRTTIDGVLDLSPDSHSLASRVPLSADTVAFSYCLPSVITSHGFLSIAAARPELSGRSVTYTALRTNPAHPNTYFVQLTGLTVGGKNIPVPPAEFAGDSMLALHTTFTYLKPDIYAVLREEFVGQMKRYRHRRIKPVGDLDTCYDFAGLSVIVMPSILLAFDGGAFLQLGIEQMMYLEEPHNAFSVACLAFAAWPDYARFGSDAPVVTIGTLAQTKTEVAYDLLGGKVGFAPSTC